MKIRVNRNKVLLIVTWGVTLLAVMMWLPDIFLMLFKAKCHMEYSLSQSAASIGIIGGADGPTAVFITNSIPLFSEIVKALTLVVAIMMWIIRRIYVKGRRNRL